MNKLSNLGSFPWWSPMTALLSKQVVVPDSSEFIDGVPGRRWFSGKGWLLYTFWLKPGVKLRSNIEVSSGERRRFCIFGRMFILGSWSLNTSVQSDTSSISTDAPRNSEIGRNAPPRRTVSTAAWQTCQLPVHNKPTAPLTGFTVLPAASYNKDWNKAASKIHKINQSW